MNDLFRLIPLSPFLSPLPSTPPPFPPNQTLSCISTRIAKEPFFHATLLSPCPLFTLLSRPLGPHPPPPGVMTMILSPGFMFAVFLPPRLMICSSPSPFPFPRIELPASSSSSSSRFFAALLRFRTHKFIPQLPSSPPASPYG